MSTWGWVAVGVAVWVTVAVVLAALWSRIGPKLNDHERPGERDA